MRFLVALIAIVAATDASDLVRLHPESDLEASLTNRFDLSPIVEAAVKCGINAFFGELAKEDPYLIPKQEINTEQIKLLAENIEISGFSTLTLNDAKINISEMTAHLSLRLDTLSIKVSSYDVNALFGFFPLYGNGLLNLNVKGLNLSFGGKLNLTPVSLSNVTLDFGLEETNLEITGLFGNEPLNKLISALVTESGPGLLKNFGKALSQIFSKEIEKLINEVLNPKTQEEIRQEIIRSLSNYVPVNSN